MSTDRDKIRQILDMHYVGPAELVNDIVDALAEQSAPIPVSGQSSVLVKAPTDGEALIVITIPRDLIEIAKTYPAIDWNEAMRRAVDAC